MKSIELDKINKPIKRNFSFSKFNECNLLPKEEILVSVKTPRNKSSEKFKQIVNSFNRKLSEFDKAYNYYASQLFPLIIKPNDKMIKNKYSNSFSCYCFTCNTYFFDLIKNCHEKHSIINLKKVEIKDSTIKNAIKNIKQSIFKFEDGVVSYNQRQ